VHKNKKATVERTNLEVVMRMSTTTKRQTVERTNLELVMLLVHILVQPPHLMQEAVWAVEPHFSQQQQQQSVDRATLRWWKLAVNLSVVVAESDSHETDFKYTFSEEKDQKNSAWAKSSVEVMGKPLDNVKQKPTENK
jgi:hypothetical protein